MRQILLSTVALAALAGSAIAADLPSSKAPPVYVAPAPVYSWTGVYLGVYGGGVFGTATVTDPLFAAGHYNQSPGGGVFGGIVGYNFQFNPNWVIGIEGEGGWQGINQTSNFNSAATPGIFFNQKVETDYSARIRGRLGYAFGDRALLFVAGGVSFTDVNVNLNTVTIVDGPYSIRRDLVGWNIGGGVDYAFTPNWIGRVEYIYDNYGTQTYAFANLPVVGGARATGYNNRTVRLEDSTIRAALIYKFGMPAPVPVVAKY